MDRKAIKLLKYYLEWGQKIQLTRNDKIKVEGSIIKMGGLFQKYLILELPSKSTMKIFLENIAPDSIIPVEVSELNTNSKTRKSIPQSVRMELWRNHFGDQYIGKCFVCKDEIQKDNFHAGHIVAHADSGSDTADNMRSICKTCNTSMGTMNLLEFKAQYH